MEFRYECKFECKIYHRCFKPIRKLQFLVLKVYLIHFCLITCFLSGLAVLHKDLSNRFKCQTKVLVHSTATGFKTDLFKDSTRGSKEVRKDFQIIFTVIYTTEIPEITCYAGSATLTGCATVTRFMGRLVDLYPVEVSLYFTALLCECISQIKKGYFTVCRRIEVAFF